MTHAAGIEFKSKGTPEYEGDGPRYEDTKMYDRGVYFDNGEHKLRYPL